MEIREVKFDTKIFSKLYKTKVRDMIGSFKISDRGVDGKRRGHEQRVK